VSAEVQPVAACCSRGELRLPEGKTAEGEALWSGVGGD